jgi:hypothetical protein
VPQLQATCYRSEPICIEALLLLAHNGWFPCFGRFSLARQPIGLRELVSLSRAFPVPARSQLSAAPALQPMILCEGWQPRVLLRLGYIASAWFSLPSGLRNAVYFCSGAYIRHSIAVGGTFTWLARSFLMRCGI